GIAYDQIFLNLLSNAGGNQPRVLSDVKNAPFTSNIYPTLPAITTVAGTFNPTATFSNLVPDAQNPTAHFYSFSIQREFAKTNLVEIGYSGNRSYHQIRANEWNYGTV